MDIQSRIRPLPLHASFRQIDWLTWGGTVARTEDGIYHMLVSRWPRSQGHRGWVTHSEVAHAIADHPLGPYVFQSVVMGAREGDWWDRDVVHNPTLMSWEGRYYLYYTGNYGDGEYWDHRNHQRIGVAVADSPAGPWTRMDEPLLEVTPGAWDSLITTNPSCTPTPDGRFMLMYKAAGHDRPLPMGGPVLHGVAFADSPTGPFEKYPEPLFAAEDASFPAEDPFVWTQGGKLYAILKDQGRYYTDEERALVLFESDDGTDWRLSDTPVVTTRTIAWENGQTMEYSRLERPQMLLLDGKPAVLFVAVKPDRDDDDSYNIHIPLRPTGHES